MFNEVILVGKIKNIGVMEENKREIVLEVERCFKESEERTFDLFVCKLWSAIFNKIISYCSYGDIIVVKGRLVKEGESCYIMGEHVVLLNKYIDNVSK